MYNIKSVDHLEHVLRTLKEVSRSYLTVTKDLTRVIDPIKALYRGWLLLVLATKYMHSVTVRNGSLRSAKPASSDETNTITQQLDVLRLLRQDVRRDLLVEAKKLKGVETATPDSGDRSGQPF